MKILIYSPCFYPNLGGLETVVSILAHEFLAQGNTVQVITTTPATDSKGFPFPVIRNPSPLKFLKLIRWCDLYFQPNISLKGVWPLLVSPKPWVISHNNWYSRHDGHRSWQDRLKHFALRFASGISVSQAVAKHVPSPSTVVPNPYRAESFQQLPHIQRDRELVFLGRLVSDKGADLLLEAMGTLKQQGIRPRLTIIGKGPEEAKLRQQAQDWEITDQVTFAGIKVEQKLVELLNAHQIMVVPSRWQEPFGIVALEGIACGCVVVGSEGGGLKDAISNCGLTFTNGDSQALAEVLQELLTQPEQISRYREHATTHLSCHQPKQVAKAYLEVFQEALS